MKQCFQVELKDLCAIFVFVLIMKHIKSRISVWYGWLNSWDSSLYSLKIVLNKKFLIPLMVVEFNYSLYNCCSLMHSHVTLCKVKLHIILQCDTMCSAAYRKSRIFICSSETPESAARVSHTKTRFKINLGKFDFLPGKLISCLYQFCVSVDYKEQRTGATSSDWLFSFNLE